MMVKHWVLQKDVNLQLSGVVCVKWPDSPLCNILRPMCVYVYNPSAGTSEISSPYVYIYKICFQTIFLCALDCVDKLLLYIDK